MWAKGGPETRNERQRVKQRHLEEAIEGDNMQGRQAQSCQLPLQSQLGRRPEPETSKL